MRSTWQPWTNRRLHVMTGNSAWLLHGVPGRARRPRATQREGTRPERRSTREPSFINEHPASSMSLRSHSIQNAQRQTALLQPSSRAAVDERRRTDPRAIQREQPRPTGRADSQRSPLQASQSASALNQPPAHRAAESTQLSTTASRPRPWATEGPSAAGRREARHAVYTTPQTTDATPAATSDGRGFGSLSAAAADRKCIRRLCRWIVASRDRISQQETHGLHPLAVFN